MYMFILDMPVSVGICGRVSVGMDMGLCGALQFPPVSQPKARCHAKFRISLTMNIDGDAYTTLLVRIYRMSLA